MAFVQPLGKPKDAHTFGDLSDIFRNIVLAKFDHQCTRVDVIIAEYKSNSIKGMTKQSHIVKDLTENKINFANFLWNELQALPQTQELVIAEGFKDNEDVKTTSRRVMCHIWIHTKRNGVTWGADAALSGFQAMIVSSQDTDLILIDLIPNQVWLKVGTSNSHRFIATQNIRAALGPELCNNLLSFHDISGCDTTSQFCGIGKKVAWKVYQQNPHLLDGIGVGVLSPEKWQNVAKFVVHM